MRVDQAVSRPVVQSMALKKISGGRTVFVFILIYHDKRENRKKIKKMLASQLLSKYFCDTSSAPIYFIVN